MTFVDAIKTILSATDHSLTPQEIRDTIKKQYPKFYGTGSHIRFVEKKYCKDLDHALLAQIYTAIRMNKSIYCDTSEKPMKISLVQEYGSLPSTTKPSRKLPSGRIDHKKKIKYEGKIIDILENAEKYHSDYYKAETFHGPSLYFHQRALETRQNPSSMTHLEYVYATLSSWGMHRMGPGGSKMQRFKTFHSSIQSLQIRIAEAQNFNLRKMSDHNWATIEEIFKGIKVMASGTSLVGNSKVMHHMLPNIVPPIDREYTLQYLRGNKNIKNDLSYEWQLMKEIIANFFMPIVLDAEFVLKGSGWMMKNEVYPWDTSILKIVDNLLIGSVKTLITQKVK